MTQRRSSKVANGWKRAQVHRRKHTLKKLDLKSCPLLFFDKKGMSFTDYVPEGQTIIMQNITKQFSWNWSAFTSPPPKWPKYCCSNFKLHHDNAHPHVANEILQFLATKNVKIFSHPSYNPIQHLATFSWFQQWKKTSKAAVSWRCRVR